MEEVSQKKSNQKQNPLLQDKFPYPQISQVCVLLSSANLHSITYILYTFFNPNEVICHWLESGNLTKNSNVVWRFWLLSICILIFSLFCGIIYQFFMNLASMCTKYKMQEFSRKIQKRNIGSLKRKHKTYLSTSLLPMHLFCDVLKLCNVS